MLDVFDEKDLQSALQDQHYVVNAGPYFLAEHIAKAASITNTNYFDLTEDVQQTNIIRNIADSCRKDIVFVPQCGLAPGFISIVANHLALGFDDVYDIKMRVGALPKHPNNSLRYNMTWSTDGLVNEYLHPCNAVVDGNLITVLPLEGYETFNLNGDEYEAFNTSGGLGTLCETWSGKARNIDYKSVRYPGHHKLMKFLISEMKLGSNNGQPLKELMNDAIPSTRDDVVLIYVSVTGMAKGKFTQSVWSKKVYSQMGWTAIELTTAQSLCAMVGLHGISKLPHKGFVKQEMVQFEDYMRAMDLPIITNVYR